MDQTGSKRVRINCLRCKHFYITWDEQFPRGCRFFQFKTRQMPSLMVFRASGIPCMEFTEKEGPSRGRRRQ